MVHRSMKNGSRAGRRIVYKESVDGVGGFPFLLSLLVLLYSKQQYDFERYSDSCSLDTHFEFSSETSISPAPDPARYNDGPAEGHLPRNRDIIETMRIGLAPICPSRRCWEMDDKQSLTMPTYTKLCGNVHYRIYLLSTAIHETSN